MKKILLFAIFSFFAASAFAQKYEQIKNMLVLPGQFEKAKQEFDKQSANEKFYTKPEGYILKSRLYAAMILDSAKIADIEKNTEESYNAFLKYKEMDPSSKLLEDATYQNTPYWLYATYYNNGARALSTQDEAALAKGYKDMKTAVELSEFLIDRKIQLKGPIDTTLVFYTGYLAERNNDFDGMVKYYSRLADAKVNTEKDHERIYQNLVRYYATKSDEANFLKYRALGKEQFPNSEFFTYNLLDFASSIGDFGQKITNIEKLLATNPNNKQALLQIVGLIFDTLHTQKEGAVRPSNYAELEGKMINALNKLVEIDSTDVYAFSALGDHYFLNADDQGNLRTEAEIVIDKKGSKATAEEKKKFADADAKYKDLLEKAAQNYIKAANLYSKKGNLDQVQKRSYRIIVGNIVTYYGVKREGKSGAELNRLVALEKKYNDLYEQLRR